MQVRREHESKVRFSWLNCYLFCYVPSLTVRRIQHKKQIFPESLKSLLLGSSPILRDHDSACRPELPIMRFLSLPACTGVSLACS